MAAIQIKTANAPQPGGSYSQAIRAGNLIAIAGQVGSDPKTGLFPSTIFEQVNQAIENLSAVLQAAGSGLESVIKTTCFLADIDDFKEFDEAYRTSFREPFPARSTFGVSLAGDLRFEIEALALVN